MPRFVALALLALAAVWGSSYLFIEIALRDFDPVVVACARQLVAAVCLAPLALRRGELSFSARDLGWAAVIAVVMVGGPTLLVAAGQQTVSSGLAAILISTTPILTAGIAFFIGTEERAGPSQVLGILVGLAGVVLLFGADLSGSSDAALGGLALLVASIGYAVGGFLVRYKASGVAPLGLVVAGSAISALILAPVALAALPDATPSVGGVLALVELGAVGTAVGWALYYWLIRRSGPQRASLVQYLAPAVAVLLGVALLDEELRLSAVSGLVLILVGSWLAARMRNAPIPPRP